MNSFAIFRLPYEQHSTLMVQHEGQPLELASPAELNGLQGFVMAPFAVTPATPILLLRPDHVCQVANSGDIPAGVRRLLDSPHLLPPDPRLYRQDRTTYAKAFGLFYDALLSGHHTKLVLSRAQAVRRIGLSPSPLRLFFTAANCFPRLFIALVSMPHCGTWLIATPETLLSATDGHYATVALAGTQKLVGDELLGEGSHIGWDTKNMKEQRYVASYIEAQLKPFACRLSESGPRTVRAANLVHLRSDFRFTLAKGFGTGDLLETLHPTPAVCGLPKNASLRFILDNEPMPRRYYSGFMGPLSCSDTHLYVTLRCMEITTTDYCLYAGGGLVEGSREEQEWLETEAKMETMRRCLNEATAHA